MSKVENYKLENLLNAIKSVQAKEGLDLASTFKLAHISKTLETSLVTYMETRRDVVKKFTVIDEETNQQKITDQMGITEALEEIAKLTIEFDTDMLHLNVKKDSGVFTVQLLKSFMDVFGDNFKVEEY